MLLIRSFKESDLQEVLVLRKETIEHINSKDYNEEQISAWVGKNEDERRLNVLSSSYTIVAVIDEEIVGYANIFLTEAYLDQLFVHKNHQHTHIAEALLQAIEQKAKEENINEIKVESSITAKGFFLKTGFNIVLEQEKSITESIALKNFVMNKVLV